MSAASDAKKTAEAEAVYTINAVLLDGSGSDTWILSTNSPDELYQMPAQNLMVSNGMTLEVFWNDTDETLWPARLENISAVEILDEEKDNRYDIGEVVLEELWRTGSVPENNPEYLCIDLSEADFFDQNTKEWLIYTFWQEYAPDSKLLTLTKEQLKADGYLEDDSYEFANEIYLGLITENTLDMVHIEASKWTDDTDSGSETLNFSAEKISEDWCLSLEGQN